MAQEHNRDQNRALRSNRHETRAEDLRDRDDQVITVQDSPAGASTAAPATGEPRYSETRRTPPTGDRTVEVDIPAAANLGQDRVRWGPIIAGFLTALTTLLLLGVLGLAIGLTAVDARAAAARGDLPAGAGPGSAIWAALSGIIAFLLGGYVAGKTAAVFNRNWGAFNGAMVFFLAVPAVLLLAGMGLGGVLGTLGSFAGGLTVDPGTVQNTAQNAAGQAQQAASQVQPEDVGRAAEAARNGAWGTLLGLGLTLGASALGGLMGTRRELEVDRRTGAVHD